MSVIKYSGSGPVTTYSGSGPVITYSGSGPVISSNPKPPPPASINFKPGLDALFGIAKKIKDYANSKSNSSKPTNKNKDILRITYPDKNTPSFSGDPGLRTIYSDNNSGYYYEPTYGYSSEPWGPGLVDTFRGSGLPDPFFI